MTFDLIDPLEKKMSNNNVITFSDVLDAKEKISPYVHECPVVTSSTLDKMVGRKVFFKAESFQKTGSFKARGALNAVLITTLR